MHRLRAKHILIADDQAIDAGVLAAALRDAGSVPFGPFADLAEATTAVNRQTVDAAVVGLRLGGVLAVPLIRLIDALGIPILVVADQLPGIIPPELLGIRLIHRPPTAGETLQLLATTIDLTAGALRAVGTDPARRPAQALQAPGRAQPGGPGTVVTPVAFTPGKPPG